MNPYFKTTKGYNAEVVVPKSYTTQTTVEGFLTNAVEGEIAIIDQSTGMVAVQPEPSTGVFSPLPAGTVVSIIQKRSGVIHTTAPFTLGSGKAVLTPYAAPAKNKWTIDATGLAIVAGTVYEVNMIELTRLTHPYNMWNFDAKAKAGDTLANVLQNLADQINDKLAGQNYAFGQIAVATVVTNNKLVLEAAETGRYFKVALRQGLEDLTAVETTKHKSGSGSFDTVRAMEEEGLIYAGVTTNYPDQNITSEEFGKPALFSEAGKNYDTIVLSPKEVENSPLPFHQHVHQKYVVLAYDSSITALKNKLKSIFGF